MEINYILIINSFFALCVGSLIGWYANLRWAEKRERKLIDFMRSQIAAGTPWEMSTDDWIIAFDNYLEGAYHD